MFFHRRAPTDMRTRLVDDLLEANDQKRLEILDRAVRDGELRKAEADELLRLVLRLESVLRSESPVLSASSENSAPYAA